MRTEFDSLHIRSYRLHPLSIRSEKRCAIAPMGELLGIPMQPSSSSSYSRRAVRKLPRWLQRVPGLRKRLGHQEILRMLRAARAAEDDARPHAIQVVPTPWLVRVKAAVTVCTPHCTGASANVAGHELGSESARLRSRQAKGCGVMSHQFNRDGTQ